MIKNGLNTVRERIPKGVTLVAVSKTKPISMIQEAYDEGQRVFGENKALELAEKHDVLPNDIEWHFIGHLQTNKVKYIAPFVHLVHSVDSFKVLKKINSEALKNSRIIHVLLQFHIAQEESKFGFDEDSIRSILKSDEFSSLKNVRVIGIMGMATYTDDLEIVRAEFKKLKLIFDRLKSHFFSHAPDFSEISMGMSGDYQTAIEEGSTMVRIGSSIFGRR